MGSLNTKDIWSGLWLTTDVIKLRYLTRSCHVVHGGSIVPDHFCCFIKVIWKMDENIYQGFLQTYCMWIDIWIFVNFQGAKKNKITLFLISFFHLVKVTIFASCGKKVSLKVMCMPLMEYTCNNGNSYFYSNFDVYYSCSCGYRSK